MKTSNRFRICSFIQYYFPVIGGTENQARLLNEELVRRGHSVFVVTARLPGSPTHDTIGGVQVRRFPFPPLFWRPYGPSAVRFLVRSLRMALFLWRRRKHIDLIHVHLFREPALVAAFMNRLLRKPILVKVACSGMAGDVHYLTSINLRPFFCRLIAELPHAVTVNAEAAAEIAKAFPATKVLQILPNGVDHRKYSPRPQGHGRPGVRLIYCGRLAPEKDVETILKAMMDLKPNPCVEGLLIAGDGMDRDRLERLSVQNELGKEVRFLGRVDSGTLYERGDIYVSASRSEGMPNSVLEAMAAGLVPVCTNIPGHQELILPGVNGFLFEAGNPAALGAHIARLAADVALRKTLAENARRRIENGFAISKVADRYEALYASLRGPEVSPLRALREEEIRVAVRALRGHRFRRALEIGAGDGFHATALGSMAPSVVLTDADLGKLKRLNHPYRVACKAEELPFRDGSFDLISSSLVWEHLDHRVRANVEVVRVLSAGGRVLHILPTRLWKSLQFGLYFTTFPARLRMRWQQERKRSEGRGADAAQSSVTAGREDTTGRLGNGDGPGGLMARLAAWLVPPIHGTYPTHLKEWKAFGRRAWLTEAGGTGLLLEGDGPLLFYSPYLLFGTRLLLLRRLLGYWGLPSARYFLFQKKPLRDEGPGG